MKRFLFFLSILSLLASTPYAQVQQVDGGGGSDASGGGNYLDIQIFEGQLLAIDALSQELTPEILRAYFRDEDFISLVLQIKEPLLANLKISEFSIYKQEPSSHNLLINDSGDRMLKSDFVIDGEEKTFITDHHPRAVIKVNFPHYQQCNTTREGTAALFVRDCTRHLKSLCRERFNIQLNDEILRKMQNLGLILAKKRLLQAPPLSLIPPFIPEPASANNTLATEKIVTFTQLKNDGKTRYIFEKFFEYYIQDGIFSSEDETLIHEAYTLVSNILMRQGLPINYKYMGKHTSEVREQLEQYRPGRSYFPLEIESVDKKNVIYQASPDARLFQSSSNGESEPFLAFYDHMGSIETEEGSYHGLISTAAIVKTSQDFVINHHIKNYPYVADNMRYPCLCEVIGYRILFSLNISAFFNVHDFIYMDVKDMEIEHTHFQFFDEFYRDNKAQEQLKKYLDTVYIVASPRLQLLAQSKMMSIYQAANGIFIKLSDTFRKLHYKKPLIYISIEKEAPSFFENSMIAKTRKPVMSYVDPAIESIFTVRDAFFSLEDTYWDPMIEALAIGESIYMHELSIKSSSMPQPGTPCLVKTFRADKPDKILTSLSFTWPDLRREEFTQGHP